MWVVVLAIFVAAWRLLESGSALAPAAVGGLVLLIGVVIFVAALRATRTSHKLAGALKAIELARLRERTAEAIALARALLRTPLAAQHRAHVLLALGSCAESEGDFAEAAEVLVKAEGTLRAGTMDSMVRNQYLALVAARRAFAHAACGDLARARATLASARVPDGLPAAAALARRAELVVVAREGLATELDALLARSETLLRNTLAWRDRALVHVMRRMASPSAHATHLELEPDLLAWVLAVLGPNAKGNVS